MIYLINKFGTNEYKIGITKRNIGNRLKEHQTGNSDQLVLVCNYESNYDYLLETMLKQHFRTQLYREGSEWFDLTQEQVNNFEELCKKKEEVINFMKKNNHFWR